MPVCLIICWVVHAVGFIRVAGVDVFAFDNPNAYSLHSSCIHITRIFNGHLCISRMKAACMFVIKPLLAPDKNFP